MHSSAASYPWAAELEKTMVNSLVTSFGLDFLLFEDKLGGDVNTTNNARQKIWATDDEKQRYDERGDYAEKVDVYHQHENYKATGARDKELQQEGKLHDEYRSQTMAKHEKRNLDHVIAAKEIHDDPAQVLAEMNAVDLANRSSNLQTTHETINKSKKQTPTAAYLEKLPDLIASHEAGRVRDQQRLETMPRKTPEQQHQARQLEDKIRKDTEKIETLKSIDSDAMRAKDAKARKEYNAEIDRKYYTSAKFLGSTAVAAGKAGLKMGARQMLGMIAAEFWFELRESLPRILSKLRKNFKLETFLVQVRLTLRIIWKRLQLRFHDFLITFKDGVFAGVLSSLTTTLFNIFATTAKNTVKIIREVWGQLVKAVKLLAFNPEQLSLVDLCKAVIAVLSTGVATVLGTSVHAQLMPICSFPFGGELASFCGALVTGVFTLGLNYFILHSSEAQKLWDHVQNLMPHYGDVIKFQSVNIELDAHLIKLAHIEFNLDAYDLHQFDQLLSSCVTELQRSLVIKTEVEKRGIELPFDMGSSKTTRAWLSSLAKQ